MVVSLTSRLESNKEEEEKSSVKGVPTPYPDAQDLGASVPRRARI